MWFDIMIDKLLKLFKCSRAVHGINSTNVKHRNWHLVLNKQTYLLKLLESVPHFVLLASCWKKLSHLACSMFVLSHPWSLQGAHGKRTICACERVWEAPAAVVGPSEVPNVPWTASIDSTVRIPPVPNPPPLLFFSLSASFRSPPLPSSPSVSRFVFT